MRNIMVVNLDICRYFWVLSFFVWSPSFVDMYALIIDKQQPLQILDRDSNWCSEMQNPWIFQSLILLMIGSRRRRTWNREVSERDMRFFLNLYKSNPFYLALSCWRSGRLAISALTHYLITTENRLWKLPIVIWNEGKEVNLLHNLF